MSFVIEFRNGGFFQNLQSEHSGPKETAQEFSSKDECETFMKNNEWILFNGGIAMEYVKSKMTFMAKLLLGETSPKQIDTFIAYWHNDPTSKVSLAKYLGMSDKMYAMFVETPKEFFERYTPYPPTLKDKISK